MMVMIKQDGGNNLNKVAIAVDIFCSDRFLAVFIIGGGRIGYF